MDKTTRKTWALAALAALGLWCARPAGATTNPARLDLTVTFTGTLSVTVDGVQYSTRDLGSLNAGATYVPASSATVRNDSSGLTEKWQLSAVDVSTTDSNNKWTVVNTTGSTPGGNACSSGGGSCPAADQVALQALFISSQTAGVSCPINTNGDWDVYMSTVDGNAKNYTSTRYADINPATAANYPWGSPDVTTPAARDGNMYATVGRSDGAGKRGLCVRLTMPAGSADLDTHIIRLTITAVAGG